MLKLQLTLETEAKMHTLDAKLCILASDLALAAMLVSTLQFANHLILLKIGNYVFESACISLLYPVTNWI